MIAAIDAWAEVVDAGFGMVETGIRTQEMLVASGSVIGKRMAAMGYAARHPARGDYSELARMVPEKVAAFSEAGRIVTREWSAGLLDASRHAHHVSSVVLRGQLPSASELVSLGTKTAAHGTRAVTRAMSASGRVLAPIHGQATSNARRLRST